MRTDCLQEFSGLDSMTLLDVLELVEVCQDSLDDVWKCDCVPVYPEKRMKHLMDLIGTVFLNSGFIVHLRDCIFKISCMYFF